MRIIELEKNKYKVVCDIGKDYKGKRKRVSKTFKAKSKRALNALIKDWLDTIDTNKGEKGLTVAQLCDSVWGNVTRNKSQNTVIGYNVSLKRIKSTIGAMRASEVSPRVLQEWIDKLEEEKSERTKKPLSPKSIKETYAVLRLCYSVAVTWDMVTNNPCHDVMLPMRKKKDVKILNNDDFNEFVKHLDTLNPNTRVLFELALFCGLRRGEIMALHEDDVQSSVILITKARYNNHKDSYEKETKTSAGNRKCFLPKFLFDDINDLKEHHKKEAERLGTIWVDTPYLVKMDDGRAFSPNEANKRLKRYMLSIGLDPINFHALRHTYASMIIASGADIATVSNRLGHTDINTTLGIYTHIFDNNETVDPISDYFEKLLKKEDEHVT